MTNDFRYEVKFVLNEREMTHALSWLTMIGAKKRFPDRIVNSLYFDNVAQEAVRDNLAGISHRNKIRLRCYGDQLSNPSDPKLEIKTREGRLGSKTIYPLSADILLTNKNLYALSRSIFHKLQTSHFTHMAINNYLVPMLLVKYQREYYEVHNGIRITIDKKIRFFNAVQNNSLDSLKPIYYNPYIMEIKFPTELKNHVANLIRSLHLTPKRHSKYLTGLAMLGYVKYI